MSLTLLALLACYPGTAALAPGGEGDCADGTDDDGDGLIDCEDGDCAADAACYESDCGDGVDNDADSLADCLDEDCWGAGVCPVVQSRVLGGEMWHEKTLRTHHQYFSINTTRRDLFSKTSVQLSAVHGTAQIWTPTAATWQECSWAFDSGVFTRRVNRNSTTYAGFAIIDSSQRTVENLYRANFVVDSGCPLSTSAMLLPASLRTSDSAVYAGDALRYHGLIYGHSATTYWSGDWSDGAGSSFIASDKERWFTQPLSSGGTWTFGYEPGAAR